MTKSTKSAPSRHQVLLFSSRYHDGSIRLRVPASDEWGTRTTEHAISTDVADRLIGELFAAILDADAKAEGRR